ncbi:hypothetical protein UFOVP152_31 [uncultured Caudovirales phage]|uniref:Uncharacterized protein n=1 Tax=uncultured Caudovirales phage TaxID=2100421 RepID=A0A6J7WFB2_9CAUD|nr:hypothetical protein UFOVP152_31 [uncultured Caudovirales phage]
MIPRFLTNWLSKQPQITPAEAAHVLSRHAHEKQRAKIRAVARQMRADMGMEPDPVLAPRR